MQEDKINNNLCNVREYDSSIIANRIKRECLKRDIILKVMLSDLKMNINTISAMCNKGQMPAADRLAKSLIISAYLLIIFSDVLTVRNNLYFTRYPARLVRTAQRLVVGGLSVGALSSTPIV